MRPKFHAPGKIRHSKWMRRACEVASKTVEPPCQDVSAKGMSLGNGFARRAAGLGQFIRSAAGTAANPRRFHAHGKIRHSEGHYHAIEVAFETVEPLRQDVSAKGMPFGKRLRPARCWIGRFIRSAAEIWTDPEGSTRLGDDQSRSFSQNKANHDFALREATTAGRQHFAHPWVLYAGKALSAFAEVSPHAVDFACAQNKGAAREEAMKEIPPQGRVGLASGRHP